MAEIDTLKSLGVMVLDDNIERAVMVERSLLQNGFRVLSMLTSASGLLNQIEQHQPDVIVIDLESPDRDVLDAAPLLAPLPLATAMGVGGIRADMVTGLVLGLNGNAITVANHLARELDQFGSNPAESALSSAQALRSWLQLREPGSRKGCKDYRPAPRADGRQSGAR